MVSGSIQRKWKKTLSAKKGEFDAAKQKHTHTILDCEKDSQEGLTNQTE